MQRSLLLSVNKACFECKQALFEKHPKQHAKSSVSKKTETASLPSPPTLEIQHQIYLYKSITCILYIESGHIEKLVVRNRIKLVFACCVVRIFKIFGIVLSVIHIVFLLCEVGIECG